MKKIVLITVCTAGVYATMAQTKAKPKPRTAVAATTVSAFKNTTDSLSYAIGANVATYFKEQGVKQVNSLLVQKAFDDVFKTGKTKLSGEQVQQVLMTCMQQIAKDKTSVTRKAGEAFLDENKKKAGIVVLPSGLQYQVIKEGTGAKPALTDKVKVHYHGTLIDGTVFDSSVDRGEPIVLSVNGVIPGWTEALQMMTVGSKWKLFLPSHLAYGDRDAGPTIKGGSTLVFDVELLGIEPKEGTGATTEEPKSE
ncbi:FKBP-type peptidyl-prolyl cis-trans isomerase [Foetidibacter luteolus]|uniref:FKBP-type peptidyl-prolyl cis-trans isomerase n=1 Tax=Foetidibacter luteolus TaxID=2608880 RepID=UPI00129A63CD|nr:FKBP-type peptidyl-prolyl cis-trans isomerase [Foetidibacter luteolus]